MKRITHQKPKTKELKLGSKGSTSKAKKHSTKKPPAFNKPAVNTKTPKPNPMKDGKSMHLPHERK